MKPIERQNESQKLVEYKRRWNFIISSQFSLKFAKKMNNSALRRTAFNGWCKSYNFSFSSSINSFHNQIRFIIENLINVLQSPSKFFLILTAWMIKNERLIKVNFRHKTKLILNQGDRRALISEAIAQIQTHMDTYLKNGSGWRLHCYDEVCWLNFINFIS